MTRERLLPPHFSRTLLTIALPIILQNLMQSLVNMLDTIMVGQLGEPHLHRRLHLFPGDAEQAAPPKSIKEAPPGPLPRKFYYRGS